MQAMRLSSAFSPWIAQKEFQCLVNASNCRQGTCIVTDVIGDRAGSNLPLRKAETERLYRWLQGLGHHDCNLCLERWPRNSTAPGYGMVAGPGGVRKGDVIVRVPEKAFMTEQTAAKCKCIGSLAAKGELSAWQSMCLHLLCERARGPHSPWYPYISLLPGELEMAGAHPMLWPQRMRSEWLAGSPMKDTIEQRLLRCREDHAALLAAGASELLPAGPGSGGFVTEAAVRWAAVILLSRAFSLDLHQNNSWDMGDDGPQVALVPWADMLNHSSKAGQESCLVFDRETGFATLRSHKSYEQGEQVYDSYGPSLSSSQLLLDYGFVDEDNSNHAVELQASVLGPVRHKLNAELLEAVGLPIEGAIFVVTQEGVDDSVKAWTRAATASVKELKEAGWTESASQSGWSHMAASSAMARLSRSVSRENEAEVIRRLLWACESLSQRYPTALHEDIANLVASDDGRGPMAVPVPWAKKQAMMAIISEKLALQGAQECLGDALRRLQSGDALHSIYRRSRDAL